MTGDDITSTDYVYRPEEEIISQYICENESPIHIFGEPGVGKTTILDRIQKKHTGDLDIDWRNMRPNHSINEIFRVIHHALFDALPEDQ